MPQEKARVSQTRIDHAPDGPSRVPPRELRTLPSEDPSWAEEGALGKGQLAVSVIIPVHNGGKGFRDCLHALGLAQPPPAEIIVVDDGSTDASDHVARRFGAQVVKVPTSQGPARARNLGARLAQSEILFFVDADVVVPAEAVGRIVTAFAHEPGLAALFGSYDDEPAAGDFLSQYKNLLHHYVHQTGRQEASTFWAACGAIRRQVFLDLGGFDERYHQPSIEDIELGYRLKRLGHRIQLCQSLQVKHLKRWDIASLLTSDFFHRALPWTELILRDRQFINDLNLQLASRVSVLLIWGILGALIGALWQPGFFALVGACVLALLALNAPLYRFFQRKRGLLFTMKAIPWHWFYYAYGGLALAVGGATHLLACAMAHLPRTAGKSTCPRQAPEWP